MLGVIKGKVEIQILNYVMENFLFLALDFQTFTLAISHCL